ncbi:hypothetical protein FKM82_030564 [Ascaphus truei]
MEPIANEGGLGRSNGSICKRMVVVPCYWVLVLLLLLSFPFCILGLLIVYAASVVYSKSLPSTQLVVGIFSRSSESCCEWLTEQLRSQVFRSLVKEARFCYISNNGGQKFREEVNRCDFAILYHTKNRGRINITDVTDSLYDEELQYLSHALGKNNVIVVVDDLDDSSSKERTRILQDQTSIGRLAQQLALFSKQEKASLAGNVHWQNQRSSVHEKLQQIIDVMSPGWDASSFCDYLMPMFRCLQNTVTYMVSYPPEIWQYITAPCHSMMERRHSLSEPLLV